MKSTNNYSTYDNYTVESVLAGHPDKVCDQICDTILDAYLEHDKLSKVAIECLGTGNYLVIGGEVFSNNNVAVEAIAQNVYREIGYDTLLEVANKINVQSEQLRKVVLSGAAGDQGTMYGYACDSEKDNYLPYGVYIVNSIAREIDLLRKRYPVYLPDGKVQITVKNGHVNSLVISVQHDKSANLEELRKLILDHAVSPIIPIESIKEIFFNQNSTFYNGGFNNDTGLSGRKIIIDTYCGLVPHGGGSFSGKDPTKVDRSGAYMARYVAKNIVANQLAKSCLVSVAYAFGLGDPVMLMVQTDKVEKDYHLVDWVRTKFDFRPPAIIERLDLLEVQYRKTATYGHFFDSTYNWEQIVNI